MPALPYQDKPSLHHTPSPAYWTPSQTPRCDTPTGQGQKFSEIRKIIQLSPPTLLQADFTPFHEDPAPYHAETYAHSFINLYWLSPVSHIDILVLLYVRYVGHILHQTFMTHIAAICNQKGGVGKTALTINLGAALAEEGRRVCLIDLDPQGHLTEGVGMKQLYLEEGNNLYRALTDHKDESQKLMHHVPHEKFDLIPSNYEMMLAEQTLFMTRNREHKLRSLLSETNNYDWILIDCPPNLGNLTDNALNASRLVIIPIQAETTSVRALDLLFDQIESIEQGLKVKISVLAVVPNLVQDSALSRRILSELRASIPTLTPFEIRKRVILQEAYDKGRSIFSFEAPNSIKEEDCHELRTIYTELAHFVTAHLEKEVK
jgi:chromosome partitioning protein